MDVLDPNRPCPSLAFPAAAPTAEPVLDVRDQSGRRLLASAEPIDGTAADAAAARVALAALRRGFLFAGAVSLCDALQCAFAEANRDVYDHAAWSASSGCRRARAGATAVAIDGNQLVIGLAPPGQAIVVQDGALHAFPAFESWRPTFAAGGGAPDSGPLGLARTFLPMTFATVVAPGDAVLIGTSALGRFLASTRCEELARHPDWLRAVAMRAGRQGQGFGSAAWLSIVPESEPRPVPDRRPGSVEENEPVAPVAESVTPTMRRAILVDRFRTRAIEYLERLAPVSSPPSLPMDAARRALLPPGAAYVRRYDGFSHDGRSIRLPRRGRAIAALLTLLLVVGGLFAGGV
jgi:hypothetical protein